MNRRVVVTGLGVVAPNGIGKKQFAESIFSGASGINRISKFNVDAYEIKDAAEIKNFNPTDYLPAMLVRKTDRFAQLGLVAAKLALEDAGILGDEERLRNAIVILGSGLGGSNFHEETIINVLRSGDPRKAVPSAVPRITPNAVSAHIAIHNKIQGQNLVISTACSSGAQAIGEAYLKIKHGLVDLALSGGAEAPVSEVTLACYQSLGVLAKSNCNPEGISRPFDKNRSGFVLGEGAGLLVLESYEHAVKRGAHIYAELTGFGYNCGAHHMVTPDPSGIDAADSMQRAINDAHISADEINYINAHGTGTKANDVAETNAIKIVFGKRAYSLPSSSIKSMIGHTIGAAGAIEAIACCLSIEHQMMPPTINLDNADSECDLDYVPNVARAQKLDVVLSNSFGFGSNNVSLIFRRIYE